MKKQLAIGLASLLFVSVSHAAPEADGVYVEQSDVATAPVLWKNAHNGNMYSNTCKGAFGKQAISENVIGELGEGCSFFVGNVLYHGHFQEA
jgi:hypothetical protein